MITVSSPADFGKVAVAMGGSAAEREISLISGKAVLAALLSKGVDAIAFDTKEDCLTSLQAKGVKRVFNIVHGRGGEDGELQGALDVLGIPYTGSGILGSALGMDKLRTKLCWRGSNVPTPAWSLLKTQSDVAICAKNLGFPVIVKPSLEGSSIGMAKANNEEQLTEAYLQATKYGCDVIAEQWVDGKEYTVAILNGEALPMIRLQTPNEFYDYEAKYQTNTTQYDCPCGLEGAKEEQLQALALNAFEMLGGSGWGRVDLMLDTSGNPWFLEINTVPGMTSHSLVPMAADQSGIDFETLVWKVLETSMKVSGEQSA